MLERRVRAALVAEVRVTVTLVLAVDSRRDGALSTRDRLGRGVGASRSTPPTRQSRPVLP
jgi:hypothetical protein